MQHFQVLYYRGANSAYNVNAVRTSVGLGERLLRRGLSLLITA
jgi:hypothetical protein